MSKSVLFSIKPKYCELIASGKKTIEVRKTRPKIDTPFKCYIYMTAGNASYPVKINGVPMMCHNNGGKCIIGEFVCDCISEWNIDPQSKGYFITSEELTATCLTYEQLHEYGNGKTVYGFHISDLVVYDKPKELSDFRKPCIYGEESDVSCFLCDKSGYRPDMHIDCFNEVIRPPQSWCYVEELI